jgi:hypothetical protein
MYLSPHAIKAQGKSIYRKPGAPNRSQAVARAQELGGSKAESRFLSLYLSNETAARGSFERPVRANSRRKSEISYC